MRNRFVLPLSVLGIIGAVFGIAVLYSWLNGMFSAPEMSADERKNRDLKLVKTTISAWPGLSAEDKQESLPDLAKVWQFRDDAMRWDVIRILGNTGPDAVPLLLSALKDPEDDVRMYALWGLGMAGPDARPAFGAVVAALKDPNPSVRGRATFAVRRIAARPEDAVAPLLGRFGDNDEGVRESASLALAHCGKAAVPALLESLKKDNLESRRQAVQTIGYIGPDADETVPQLLVLLRDPKSGLQDETSEALARLGNKAVAALSDAIDTEQDTAIRKRAIMALASVGPSGIPVLGKVLMDKDPTVRLQGVTALGRVGVEGVPVLVKLLKDPDAEVRQEVVRVLGGMDRKEPRVLNAIVEGMKDPQPEVRLQTRQGISGLRATPANVLPLLAPVLSDKDLEIRLEAIGFLGEFGTPAVPLLIAALKDPEVQVRQQVVRTLENMKADPTQMFPTLVELLKDDSATARQSAINILWRCGPPALPKIIEATKDRSPLVRNAAVYALYQMKGDQKVVFPVLVEALKDETASVRAAAVPALAHYGAPALPHLAEAVNDPEAIVRQWAVASLQPFQSQTKIVLPLLEKALHDDSAAVRRDAAGVLRVYGLQAVPLLLEAFKDNDSEVWKAAKDSMLNVQVNDKILLPTLTRALKDLDSGVRQGAAYSMERFGPQGVPPLIDALKEADANVHWAAVDTLDSIGGKYPGPARLAYPVLAQTAVNDPSPKVRKGALVAMLTIHCGARLDFRETPAKAVPVLIDSLKNRDADTRWEAVQILGVLGPQAKEALPELTKLTEDKSQKVRDSIPAALARIRG